MAERDRRRRAVTLVPVTHAATVVCVCRRAHRCIDGLRGADADHRGGVSNRRSVTGRRRRWTCGPCLVGDRCIPASAGGALPERLVLGQREAEQDLVGCVAPAARPTKRCLKVSGHPPRRGRQAASPRPGNPRRGGRAEESRQGSRYAAGKFCSSTDEIERDLCDKIAVLGPAENSTCSMAGTVGQPAAHRPPWRSKPSKCLDRMPTPGRRSGGRGRLVPSVARGASRWRAEGKGVPSAISGRQQGRFKGPCGCRRRTGSPAPVCLQAQKPGRPGFSPATSHSTGANVASCAICRRNDCSSRFGGARAHRR